MVKKQHVFLFLCLFVCVTFLISCSESKSPKNNPEKEPRDYVPTVLVPEASGTSVWQTENVLVDTSNIRDLFRRFASKLWPQMVQKLNLFLQ